MHAKLLSRPSRAGASPTLSTLTKAASSRPPSPQTRCWAVAGRLSMDGPGAWRDKVFVERPWRSVKYEWVYLKADDSVNAARAEIAEYIGWHNAGRAHSSLADVTPDQHYFAHLPTTEMAA